MATAGDGASPMELRRLPFGRMAEMHTDCITIVHHPDGRFRLEGAALDGTDSVSFGSTSSYATAEEAEAAGLAWAGGIGIRTLYIAHVER